MSELELSIIGVIFTICVLAMGIGMIAGLTICVKELKS